jgi:uncharacterized protein (DUF1778 family)
MVAEHTAFCIRLKTREIRMARTALLIRCSKDEADRIRAEAEKEHRTVSGYVLNVTIGAVGMEDWLFAKPPDCDAANSVLNRRALIAPGPRTAILVRCSTSEADRIREAAERRRIPINAFVLQGIRRAWIAGMDNSV